MANLQIRVSATIVDRSDAIQFLEKLNLLDIHLTKLYEPLTLICYFTNKTELAYLFSLIFDIHCVINAPLKKVINMRTGY